jgi:hypothetical protein
VKSFILRENFVLNFVINFEPEERFKNRLGVMKFISFGGSMGNNICNNLLRLQTLIV